MAAITRDVIHHLEWRQTNVPLPKLTNKTLNLLNKGILYIHGRSKDFYPIIVLDFKRLSEMLKNKEIDEGVFCSLYNYIALYIINNMTLPGQVEKWITICNINKFQIKELPIHMFKGCAEELGTNNVERCRSQFVVNLSWVQNAIARFLQSFLDADVRSR